MATLLLRLAAPLQSWGADSKFDIRKTCREPTLSGVVGLLASALGRRRDEDISDLSALCMGVRVDREGVLLRDFHMVHKDDKTSYLTTRHYLSDAVFLIALESPDEAFLETLDAALRKPRHPLFLGRRSCPPTLPISLGVRKRTLEDALTSEPWLAANGRTNKPVSSLRVSVGVPGLASGVFRQRDLPLSFDPSDRRYGFRAITRREPVNIGSPDNAAVHDPMAELEV